MIEEYEDLREAYERAKHLNRVAGRKEYVITATTDGWAVRRWVEWDRAFLTWRRNFYLSMQRVH